MLGFLTAILAASGGSSSSGSGGLAVLFPLLLMGAIFYFLLIRPQRRQRQAHQRLVESVDVGDEVVTIGGLYGTVRGMDDESLTVEVAPNVDVRVSRGAIARKLVFDDEPEEMADAEEPDDLDGGEGDDAEEDQGAVRQGWRTGPWFGRSSRRRGGGEEAGDQT